MDENEITQTNLLDFEAEKGVPMMPDSFKGICRTNGGYTKTAPRDWTDEEVEWIKGLRQRGYSLSEIAESVGRTEVSVQIKFKRLGKKEGSYNKKHVDEKYKLNQRFFDVIRPETLLDMYCGEKDWWRGVVPVVTSNDSDRKINADYNEQAERLIHKLYYEGGRFDVIDLDPYGSAYECFDCAIKMAEKGLIVTFGEMGHKRFKRLDFVGRHYGIRSLEDFTIENLILEVEKIGRRNKKRITPILIGNWNRISRVYFKIERMVVMDKCGSFLQEDVFEKQEITSESDEEMAMQLSLF